MFLDFTFSLTVVLPLVLQSGQNLMENTSKVAQNMLETDSELHSTYEIPSDSYFSYLDEISRRF